MSAMTLIETKTLASAASSIEFVSIPQDFTDLYLLLSLRFTNAVSDVDLRFNGSTTGYSMRLLFGTGSSRNGATNSSSYLIWAGRANPSSYTASTFANSSIYIPNYSGSTNKSITADGVTENNATAADQAISAGIWSNTAAITSLALSGSVAVGGNFIAGSTVSLYGILKGTDGTTVVS